MALILGVPGVKKFSSEQVPSCNNCCGISSYFSMGKRCPSGKSCLYSGEWAILSIYQYKLLTDYFEGVLSLSFIRVCNFSFLINPKKLLFVERNPYPED